MSTKLRRLIDLITERNESTTVTLMRHRITPPLETHSLLETLLIRRFSVMLHKSAFRNGILFTENICLAVDVPMAAFPFIFSAGGTVLDSEIFRAFDSVRADSLFVGEVADSRLPLLFSR